jgi:hypothetical protein
MAAGGDQSVMQLPKRRCNNFQSDDPIQSDKTAWEPNGSRVNTISFDFNPGS